MQNKDALISTIAKVLSNKRAHIANVILPDKLLESAPDTIADEKGRGYEIIFQKKGKGLVKLTKNIKGFLWSVLVWVVFSGSGIEDKLQSLTQPLINTVRIEIAEFIRKPPYGFSDSQNPYDPSHVPIYNSYVTSGATGISGVYPG